MDSRFLKFFVLFYAYNKYSERHCGIYLRFTSIFGDMILDQLSSLEPIWNPPPRNPGYTPVESWGTYGIVLTKD